MTYHHKDGMIYDTEDGQTIATMSESATPEQASILAAAPALLDLCRRSLRALDEDSYPQLRDELAAAIQQAKGAAA